jgi:hypothetical protein
MLLNTDGTNYRCQISNVELLFQLNPPLLGVLFSDTLGGVFIEVRLGKVPISCLIRPNHDHIDHEIGT